MSRERTWQGFVRKAGEGQGDVLRGSQRKGNAFSREDPFGQFAVVSDILHEPCINCAFVQGFLDASLLSGTCALFRVTQEGSPEEGAQGGTT